MNTTAPETTKLVAHRRDIVTITDNLLRVFPQHADGSFEAKPAATIERSILSEEEKETGFAGESLTFADLNGDGIADLVALKWGSSDDRAPRY